MIKEIKFNEQKTPLSREDIPSCSCGNYALKKGEVLNKIGFTLVELLISISIIAILSVVMSISFSNAQKQGRDQRRITDLKAIQNAAEQMVLLSGTYPPSPNSYRPTSSAWTVGTQVVLQKFPGDPQIVNGVGKTYSIYNNSATNYCVCAVVEKSQNSNAENNQCSFVNSSGFFCVKNQQ